MQVLFDTLFIMGFAFGSIAVLYIVYALLWFPAYLLGYRKTEKNKEM